MPRDLTFKAMNVVHRILVKASGNRLGWSALSMPVLELTSTGRKTGRRHTVMLTSPLQVDRAFVVVASRGGDDQHPAWYLNLLDTPDVEVAVQGGPAQPMHARIAEPAERDRLWPQVVADHPNYADYQRRTTRQIPLVLLEPRSAGGDPR
jgi:deazaflavin-dependent oxidoreductase (nitroreductase family)